MNFISAFITSSSLIKTRRVKRTSHRSALSSLLSPSVLSFIHGNSQKCYITIHQQKINKTKELHHHGDKLHTNQAISGPRWLTWWIIPPNPSRRNSRIASASLKNLSRMQIHVMGLKGWRFFADDARTKNSKIITISSPSPCHRMWKIHSSFPPIPIFFLCLSGNIEKSDWAEIEKKKCGGREVLRRKQSYPPPLLGEKHSSTKISLTL